MGFLESLDKVWEDWNIRGAVLFSLTMQIILIGLAPLRKLSSNRIITILIWCAYLLADAIAISSVVLIIIKTQRYNNDVQNSEEYFLALWVPFLLLHLGGPDTITAFSLEDNELWIRHLLALVIQGIIIGALSFRTFSSNKLRLPTLLLFIAGIIKYMERTCSLFLASKGTIRNSVIRKHKAGGVNLAKLGAGIDLAQNTADNEPQSLNDVEVVAEAHEYFKIFKGLMVDLVFSFKERDESRKFFFAITPENAFRVIEAELNFMYEVHYTKASVVHSILGKCLGLVASGSVIASLVIFHFLIEKQGFDKVDIGVTYALLLGAIGLDALGLLISIFSNWTTVTVFNRSSQKDNSFISKFYTAVLPVYKHLLDFKKPGTYVSEKDHHIALRTRIMFRKWSECVPCFNLVTYCLTGYPVRIHSRMSHVSPNIIISYIHGEIGKLSCAINHVWRTSISSNQTIQFLSDRCKMVYYFLRMYIVVKYWIAFKKMFIKLFHLTELLDELTHVSREPLTMQLWRFIFEELKNKSSLIRDNQETPKEYFSARGDVALERNGVDHEDRIKLMQYLVNVSYDESLLLWHIATELLYNGEKKTDNAEDCEAREFSKILSNYMLYILIWRPTMMSTIAGMAKLRYEDTCADAKRFFKRRGLRPQKVKTACKLVFDIDFVKEDERLSALFKARKLAKELRELKDNKWKIVSQVWVELLSYGANHCGATAHAQQLNKGRDLITFVWLLMGHFGLLDQFQPNSTLLSLQEK